ncbi:hypothetical protein [Streptomyces lasiicapitis]|uniref:hypothetical protein n=1 Tax=Streptomyces lasiicapitis TaxID=1923961 RepID=UPI0036483310
MDISGTQLRTARAAVFTALVVMLSAASHVLLSRAPLPLTTFAALAAAVFCVAFALAGRERGFGAIAALLIPLELAADTVFTAGQHVCYGQAGGPVAGPLRSVGFDVLCGGGSVGTPLVRMAGGENHGGGGARRPPPPPPPPRRRGPPAPPPRRGRAARGGLARARRACRRRAAEGRGRGDVPAAADRGRRGDPADRAGAPAGPHRPQDAGRPHPAARALRGTAWTAVLGPDRLSTAPSTRHIHGEQS